MKANVAAAVPAARADRLARLKKLGSSPSQPTSTAGSTEPAKRAKNVPSRFTDAALDLLLLRPNPQVSLVKQ